LTQKSIAFTGRTNYAADHQQAARPAAVSPMVKKRASKKAPNAFAIWPI
jgi:hypothetical protein